MSAMSAICALAFTCVACAQTREVPRWEPVDLSCKTAGEEPNPFSVPFSATASGPEGAELQLPGFFDGDGTWKIRFSAPELGDWKIRTHSAIAELDGREFSLRCIPNTNPRIHGGLRIDQDRPYHFVWEDGTRYFLSGYECDWLWALPVERMMPFLDALRAHGFNHVLVNAYAHDCSWRRGKTGPDDFGPPALYAWEGTNESPDFTRFNLAYWQHYDQMVRALCDRGMVAHILMKVYNKMVRWPPRNSPEEDLYFRWLIARYAAFPTVIWDFSKEAYNEKDQEYKIGRFQFIRQNDPYRRLLTVHDDKPFYDRGEDDPYVDFESDQQHSNWQQVIAAHRARRACPAVNVEYGYEHGPGGMEDKTYNVVQPPEEVLRRAWLIAMAGGYGAYYYTNTAWDVLIPEQIPPGYAYFRHFAEFFEGTHYWDLTPEDSLVQPGHCLARPGEEYVVYQEQAQPLTLAIEGARGPLAGEWFHPLSGQRVPVGPVSGGTVSLNPPWTDAPAALHLHAR
jgi:hypothetical protein